MKYANTNYIETFSPSFEEMFVAAQNSIGEMPCAAFEFDGVTVIVDDQSLMSISKDDLNRAKVMGIKEIYKPLMDAAVINEAYLREVSHSHISRCSVMEVAVYGGHVIKGFVSHEVQLTSRFQCWVRDTYGITDSEAVQMLGSRAQYFDGATAYKVYQMVEWNRVPFFNESVKISVEIAVADSDIEAIKLKLQEFAKTLIPK